MRPAGTIKYVARQTGLSIHAIRVWEKRYGAVQPVRAGNNRRLYSQEDVARLKLLREATLAGYSIGQIARASQNELQALVRESAAPALPQVPAGKRLSEDVEQLMRSAIQQIMRFDGERLHEVLERAAVGLGSPAVLQKFIAPLAERVGDLWRAGEFTVAHEHFATNHITEFLRTFARPYSESVFVPHLVLATPAGQLHELGAIIVAAAARSHGWRTTYLGAALPIEEFAGAVGHLQPRAVGLSIVFPPDDIALRADLKKLGHLLPKGCVLLAGGRSVETYADVLRKAKAKIIPTLDQLYPALDRIAGSPAPRAKSKKGT